MTPPSKDDEKVNLLLDSLKSIAEQGIPLTPEEVYMNRSEMYTLGLKEGDIYCGSKVYPRPLLSNY